MLFFPVLVFIAEFFLTWHLSNNHSLYMKSTEIKIEILLLLPVDYIISPLGDSLICRRRICFSYDQNFYSPSLLKQQSPCILFPQLKATILIKSKPVCVLAFIYHGISFKINFTIYKSTR
jgi:hypothetical protein